MALESSQLNPRFTLENFVLGPGNALAYRAIEDIATHERFDRRTPGPLYICAGVGLGKTHLLQALAAALGPKALYFTEERFRTIAREIARQTLALFDMVSDVDTVIIDDLHLIRLDAEEGSFYRPLIAFFETGRHLVFAADRLPLDLGNIRQDLSSRLSHGLIAPVSPMDESLRAAVIHRYIDHLRKREPDFDDFDLKPEAVAYIAGLGGAHGRTLEGVLNGLFARYRLMGGPLALSDVTEVVRMVHSREQTSLGAITSVVAAYYGLTIKEMLSDRRARPIVRPRQVAMYLAKTLTQQSLPMIGRGFGGRDHTTVMHAVRNIENLLLHGDTPLAEDIRILKRQLEP